MSAHEAAAGRRLLVLAAILTGAIALTNPARASEPVAVAAEGRQPHAAVGPGGRVYVAFGRGDSVFCAASADGGATFEAPVEIGSPGVLALGMRRGPRVAATRDAVVVAAIGGAQGKGKDGDLLSWRSTDGGRSWSGPTRINGPVGSAREGLHALAAGPDGTLFAAWVDLRDQAEVYGARSVDGGATWEADARIYRSPDGPICPCCHPSVAFGPDGSVCVMWRNALGGFRDMYLARSTDGGKTFAPAVKLGREGWALSGCPMDGGSIAVGADGRVETVWMRAGSMFAATPGRAERPLGAGVQGWAAAGPAGVHTLWLEKRGGTLLALPPGGDRPEPIAADALDPVVAAAPGGAGPVVAVWESGKGARGGRIVARVLEPAR